MAVVRLLLNCPDIETARRIAVDLLDRRLVACANIYPEIESHYVWQGGRETEPEIPLALKTRADLADAVEERVRALHPYDVPPLVGQLLDFVHAPYAAWVDEMTDAAATGNETGQNTQT